MTKTVFGIKFQSTPPGQYRGRHLLQLRLLPVVVASIHAPVPGNTRGDKVLGMVEDRILPFQSTPPKLRGRPISKAVDHCSWQPVDVRDSNASFSVHAERTVHLG